MDFQVNGLWRNLTWGCATAGRPSIQLVLADSSEDSHQKDKSIGWSLEQLIHAIDEPLETIRILQIHSIRFQNGQISAVGDPLHNDDIYPLVTHILEELDYRVIIHVNNKTDISMIDPRANVVLVPVVPHMGDVSQNFWPNLEFLSDDGEILFVIKTQEDYQWMKEQIDLFRLTDRFVVQMTVENSPKILGMWGKQIISDSLGVHLLPSLPNLPMKIYQNRAMKSSGK